jgi:hypothetical protein
VKSYAKYLIGLFVFSCSLAGNSVPVEFGIKVFPEFDLGQLAWA